LLWRARLVLGCVALVALCFQQAPGRVVTDSKLELTAAPGRLLARALHLWDPQTGFGQLQSDAYGYLFPMGPVHWLLDALSVPDWVAQRLWWSLVLCVGFLGIWKLCHALQYGVPATRFAVALLYAVLPRTFGELPVEVWPMAMAPWVLLPLVAARSRSNWWRVGWSALAFALIGGANPLANLAVLVVPAAWLVVKAKVKVTLVWLGFVVAVSLWWLLPLVQLTRYGVLPSGAHWPAAIGALCALPLALGAAHYLTRLGLPRRLLPALVVAVALAAALPVVLMRDAGMSEAIPAQWRQAAAWLDGQTAPGSVLVVPATEALQAQLRRPTATASQDVDERLASGIGDQTLRQELVRSGIRYVVVGHDAPVEVNRSLNAAGLHRAVGGQVEIYDAGPVSQSRLIPQSRLVEVSGTTDDVPTVLSALGGSREAVLSADLTGQFEHLPLIRTDAAASERQTSALVFRNTSDSGQLVRTMELAQAASYKIYGSVLMLKNITASYCGNGPVVRIDGVTVRTQLSTSARRPVTYALCGAESVPLRSGRHQVQVQATAGYVPVQVTLAKSGFGDVAVTPVQPVDVWRPNPAELTVEAPLATEQSVLAVAQHYNVGWVAYDSTGQWLTPIRIDGWQQGWLLPAGAEQAITARFMPDRNYGAALLVGLVALLGVLVTAVFFRGFPRRLSGRSIQR
jgi:hypothetical protein